MMKKHLLEGVTKGALTEEQADAKFEAWTNEKESKIQKKVKSLASADAKAKSKRFIAKGTNKQKLVQRLLLLQTHL